MRRDADVIELRMTDRAFGALCRRIVLNDVQERDAQRRFENYNSRVQRIADGIVDRLIPTVIEVVQAKQRREEVPRQALVDAIKLVGEEVSRHRTEANEAMSCLFQDVQSCLTDTQRTAWPAAVREWRRSVMLNPGVSGGHGRDLANHVDLIEFVQNACDDEPNLRPLLDRTGGPVGDAGLADDRRQCEELLTAYELELDALLQSQFWMTHDRSEKARVAGASGDDAALKRLRHANISDWMVVYQRSTTAAEAIASILERSLGPRCAEGWRDRYYAVYYPSLYRAKSTDLIHDWLSGTADLNDEQIKALGDAFAQYRDIARLLNSQARSLRLQIVQKLSIAPGLLALYDAAGNPPEIENDTLLLQKQKLDERRKALCEQTNLQFRGLLSEQQQVAFDEAIARIRRNADPLELEF